MLIIDEATARGLIDIDEAIEAIEQAFLALDMGEARIFPVAHGAGQLEGSSFSMKSGQIRGARAATSGIVGLKVGSYWPTNRERGLPSHGSTVLLLDPVTGLPIALIAMSYLNGLRTAAADAVAVRHLARADAATLGIVAAGHQAWFECLAVCRVRPIERVLVWSRDPIRAQAFAESVVREQGLSAIGATLEQVAGADIVITVTAAREPLVRAEWIRPGTHVSAMGADAPGKRELCRPLATKARLFADLPEQSRVIGEFQDMTDPIAPLGGLVSGSARGRLNSDEITIFDSSGLAIQDLAVAARVLGKARKLGLGIDTSPQTLARA